MSAGFGKIFETLYTGSMVGAGEHVFAVWPYCLAHVRPPGVVEVNPALVCHILGTTPEKVIAALEYLCAPDPNSRSTAEDGRRLVKVGQFEYRMVNFAEYRERMSDAARAEYQRNYMREYRQDGRDKSRSGKPAVNAGKQSLGRLGEAEAEAEAESKAINRLSAPRRETGIASKVDPGLVKEIVETLGKKEWGHNAGLWIKNATENPGKLRRVLAEVRTQIKEGLVINNIGAYAVDLWRRFK